MRTLEKMYKAGVLDGMEAMAKLVLGEVVEETIIERYEGELPAELKEHLEEIIKTISRLRVGREVLGY